MSEADLFAAIHAHVEKEKKAAYAQGFRRAVTLMARSVGQLDGASKVKISELLNALDDELQAAEK